MEKKKIEILVAEFPCQTCSQKIRARIPAMHISNHPTVSSLMFTHEQATKCSGCDSVYLPVLAGVTKELQLKIIWKKLQTRQSEIQITDKSAATGVQ